MPVDDCCLATSTGLPRWQPLLLPPP